MKYAEIDGLLAEAWKLRYSNTRKSLELGNNALHFAKNEGYTNGEMYARLYIAVTSFLLSRENKLEELLQCVTFFEQKPEEKGLPVAYNTTGNVYENIGKYNEAITYCKNGLKTARQQNYAEGIGDCSNTLGVVYMRIGDYKKAQKSFQEALDVRLENNFLAAAASSYNLLGRVNTLQKNFEDALQNYHKSLVIRQKEKHYGALPWSQLGLGTLYLEMGRPDDAKSYLEKALNQSTENKDERCQMHCLLGMGRLAMLKNESKNAANYLNKALVIAESIEAKAVLADVYSVLSEVSTQKHDFQNALQYFRKYHNLKEEILNTETHNQLKNQEIAFAVERSQKEAEIYQLKHVELKKAYDKLEEKNKEITDSINYASSIQSALLPDIESLLNYFSDAFILFKPRDIVSGDFYWIQPLGNKILITAADCTGHGVPGAFMSVLGISLLDDIVNKNGIIQPAEILFELRSKIIHALNQHKEKDKKDGMDMALCLFDFDEQKGYYAGAYNALYIIRNKELEQIKADRMPIGLHLKDGEPFTQHTFDLQPGDQFYMFSDGYADQFGGEKGRKLMSKTFKEILLQNAHLSANEQQEALNTYFEKWRGTMEQIDDVIVTGLKI